MKRILEALRLNNVGASVAAAVLVVFAVGSRFAPEPFASLLSDWSTDVVPYAGAVGIWLANLARSDE